MDNISNAIDATANKDVIGFKKALHSELSARLHAAISTNKESIAKKISTEEVEAEETEETEEVEEANISVPSAPFVGGRVGIPGSERSNSGVGEVPNPLAEDLKAELESAFGLRDKNAKTPATESSEKGVPSLVSDKPRTAGGASMDQSLDPNFEKEFYIKETDYKGHKILLKQVGLGLSKPVRVYVDNKRWEFFAGPESAMSASKSYIDGFESETNKQESADNEDAALTERVELDARTRAYRNTVTRLEQARKNKENRGNRLEETLENHNDKNFNHLYNDGTGLGAIIPKPFNFSKPSDTAKLVAGQINTTVDEAMTMMTMSNHEIMAAVNMKKGKYMMDEEELSPKQKAYRKFFNGALKKHGASSPSELTGDKKKQFFSYVKANWKG